MRRVMLALFAFGFAVATVLILTSCVGGTPVSPEDVPRQDTEWGVRRDSAGVTVTIANPFYEPADTVGGS